MDKDSKLGNWIIDIIYECIKSKMHGKIIIFMCAGKIPSIEVNKKILKPIEIQTAN